MMTKRTAAFFVLVLVTGTACTYHASRHNPKMAAASATEFARVAFVDQNIDSAFSMLDPELQEYATKEQFAEVIANMNRSTTPKVVKATEFEPIAGQDGINIYLIGENGAERFYYRIPMKGSEAKGYKAAGVFRNQGPYPHSNATQPL
jgi:hypothetical protein